MPVEGGVSSRYEPVYAVSPVQAVPGRVVLVSLVVGGPESHQHRRHQPRLGPVVLDVARQGDLPRQDGWE